MINELTKLTKLRDKIYNGYQITKDEAMQVYNQPIEELSKVANEIREHFCGNKFDICTIINGKSGKCSEDCKYCAQSAYYNTDVETYSLLSKDKFVEGAKYNDDRGVLRYSIVTSGRALCQDDVEAVCESATEILDKTNIAVCVSLGLLEYEQFCKLKQAGVSRVHNNLETSRRNFPNVCTTHTYDDKIKAIKSAQKAGLTVCSGGIMGLGETVEDRIDMALTIRELGVRSVPVNMLNPIEGTPYANLSVLTVEDMRRIVATYRFIIPDGNIRLAGGRGLLEDKGRSCFMSGANSAISGDMLTTAGITIETDLKMLHDLGYVVSL